MFIPFKAFIIVVIVIHIIRVVCLLHTQSVNSGTVQKVHKMKRQEVW